MADAGTQQKPKIFISYSRRDSSDFAEELLAGLELAGFAPFLDRHDIAAGEEWEARLGSLIQHADSVVYVISPEAVKSPRCEWEVNKAVADAKRVLPVIFKPVPEADIPHELERRQFIRFDTGRGITRPLAQLAEALRHDIDWIREHTRLSELAQRWHDRARPESMLLRGDELAAARQWAEKWKPGAPVLTDSIRTFVASSNDAEAVQLEKSVAVQRRIIQMQVLVTILLLGVIGGLVGWINQSFLLSKWRFLTVTWPYAQANIRPHVLNTAQEQALKPGDSFRECAQDCPEMTVLPAGSFSMGGDTSDLEEPHHTVTIAKPFAVSQYELTFADWDACVAGGGCNGYRPDDEGWGRGQQPVVNVNWDDAQAYVAWLSQVSGKTYKLLSEAEYEYAARAGTTTTYPWGDDIEVSGQAMANCVGCGSQWDGKQPAPVGSFPSNKFGLYDMVGNVFEWTADCAHTSYNGAPTDGSAWLADNGGDCTSRMARGGDWVGPPDWLQPGHRIYVSASGFTNYFWGFRVARTLAQ